MSNGDPQWQRDCAKTEMAMDKFNESFRNHFAAQDYSHRYDTPEPEWQAEMSNRIATLEAEIAELKRRMPIEVDEPAIG